jgi:hypothetical protein
MAVTLDTTPRTPLERELDSALHETLDEIDALKAENARLKGRLDALTSAFDADGAVGVLRSIAHDKSLPHELRYKAATSLAPYETAKKPATTHNVYSLFDDLEGRRLRALEQREAAAKVIEHAPATILGEGQGHHGAWHPIDSDKGDPAA